MRYKHSKRSPASTEDFARNSDCVPQNYAEPQSMATTKHNFQRLVSSPLNQKLFNFPDELQKSAKDGFGVAAQSIIEQFIYAKTPST